MATELFDVEPENVGSTVQDFVSFDNASQVVVRKQENGKFTVILVD